MGMYSYFETEDIEIIDWAGLVEFLELWDTEMGSWIKVNEMLDKEKKIFSFESWDDIKLISYWYDTDVVFLKCVARYIRGRVEWDFESKDEAGWVEFEDGECIFHLGITEWNSYKPEDIFRGNENIYYKDGENFEKVKKDKLNKFMLMEGLIK